MDNIVRYIFTEKKMKQIIVILALCACVTQLNMAAQTQVFNHTVYPIKVSLYGAFASKEPFEVQPGEMTKTLEDLESCVIITHISIWVKEGNMDDYAIQPNIDQEVYLDRCYKEIHLISTPNELGEYVYSITTSHE